MLKSKKLSLAAVLALLGATLVAPPAWATTVDCSSGGSFTITDNVVTGSTNCAGTATIPNSVTSIGEYAFYFATSLTAITIPNSVTSIGEYAFHRTTALKTVTFASGSALASIETSAFNGASSLTSINIPNSVTSIGSSAFSGTNSLTTISIPSSVTSIGTYAFNRTTALKTVTFASGSKLASIGGSAFNEASALTSIIIPSSVTSIGGHAFNNATALTSVTFEGNAPIASGTAFNNVTGAVANIGTAADGFGEGTTWNGLTIVRASEISSVDCSSGGSFTITDNVVTGSTNCAGTATIPNSVTSIGEYAFYFATSLTAITIPNSVTSIGEYAFHRTTALKTVTFASGSALASIETSAFNGASSLTSINIPNSVTSIGSSAFSGTNSLTTISIPSSVTSIGTYAFNRTTALKTVTFASGSKLASIGGSAFNEASALTSIIIPSSVTSIGGHAFNNATALTSVTFEGNAPIASGTAFNNVTGAVANIGTAADGFGEGTTWNGLTIVRNAGIPEVTWVTDYVIYEGFELELYGTDLDTVIGLRLGGINLKIDSKTATSIITTIPAGIAEADYSIYMTHPGGTKMHPWKFTMQAPITPEISDELKAWTKNLNDGTAKIYAKNIVGGGKIRFMLNGKEIAWVRAVSAADPKLRTANGAHYLVRTVDLVEGQKNVLEVYLDGVRIKRTAYSY